MQIEKIGEPIEHRGYIIQKTKQTFDTQQRGEVGRVVYQIVQPGPPNPTPWGVDVGGKLSLDEAKAYIDQRIDLAK